MALLYTLTQVYTLPQSLLDGGLLDAHMEHFRAAAAATAAPGGYTEQLSSTLTCLRNRINELQVYLSALFPCPCSGPRLHWCPCW